MNEDKGSEGLVQLIKQYGRVYDPYQVDMKKGIFRLIKKLLKDKQPVDYER